MTRYLLTGALAGALALVTAVGCEKTDKGGKGAGQPAPALPPQSAEELNAVIAEVDGVKISVGEFQERINKQSPYIRARYTSIEKKKEFLDNLVRFEVLAKEAKQKGLDQDPEVVRTMKQVMIQKLMKQEFETQVKPEDVSEEDMKKFFEEHASEYNKPEEVRASAIVVKDKSTADKVLAEVKGPKGSDNKGFRELVTQYSQDEASKQRGGDLRYFAADTTEVPAEVVKAAFGLEKTGDVAGPISTKQGFYVIKQTGRRKAMAKSFDEVKRQIQNRLYRDKRTKAMEDYVANLKKNAKITVNEDMLAKVRIDTSGAGAGGPPGAPIDDMVGAPGGDPHAGPHGGAMPPSGASGILPKGPGSPPALPKPSNP